MASLRKISSAYRGKTAEKYDEIREKQSRWHRENEVVAEMLRGARGPVLDCPVGTGRFFDVYAKMRVPVVGVDSSSAMLDIARKKLRRGSRIELAQGSADDLSGYADDYFQTCVCVRFLNLIDDNDIGVVMRELSRVTQSRMILTIRLGAEYYSGGNAATHDDKKFRALVRRLGWTVTVDDSKFVRGWHVMQLDRV